MALTSALYTGLSGLDVNQTKLNVIGNNIANSNTTAFKSSRAEFTPQFYLTDQSGSAPDGTNGGTNPSQRGLGAQVSSIEKDMTQGEMETTGKSTDLAIDGNGFFVVQGATQSYTRAGDFGLNDAHKLTTSGGDYVMGYNADTQGNVINGKLTQLTIPADTTSQAKATTKAKLDGNVDASGDLAVGASVISTPPLASISGAPAIDDNTKLSDLTLASDGVTPLYAAGDTLTLNGTKGGRQLAKLTYTIDANSTVGDLKDFYNQGLQIKTDEAPTGTFTPGAAFDPTTNTFKITGNIGKDNAVALDGTAFSSTNANMAMTFAKDASSNPVGESVYTNMQVYDSLGTPVNVDVTATLTGKTSAGTTWTFIASSPDNSTAKTFTPGGTGATAYYGALLGSGTINFDNNGQYVGATGNSLVLDRTGTGATAKQSIAIDFAGMTALSSQSSELVLNNQDGFATGTVNGFSIGDDGKITGSFSNGQTRVLGQLAIATFDNPEGLSDQGSNQYIASANSGAANITTPQTLNTGTIRAGSLEQSNVDISKEFINMITASTGFTASSKVITTSDQLLTDLMNTSR